MTTPGMTRGDYEHTSTLAGQIQGGVFNVSKCAYALLKSHSSILHVISQKVFAVKAMTSLSHRPLYKAQSRSPGFSFAGNQLRGAAVIRRVDGEGRCHYDLSSRG